MMKMLNTLEPRQQWKIEWDAKEPNQVKPSQVNERFMAKDVRVNRKDTKLNYATRILD